MDGRHAVARLGGLVQGALGSTPTGVLFASAGSGVVLEQTNRPTLVLTTCHPRFSAAQRLRIPMVAGSRSLNLSNAVAVAVYEVWRQRMQG